jgi:hypothetical protein
MAHRITVKDRQGQIAQERVALHDPKDEHEVLAAAKRIAGGRWSSATKVRLDREVEQDRWSQVREWSV